MKHKHADLIHAWCEGAEIEVKVNGEWESVKRPSWDEYLQYRIKPEPKPDVVYYAKFRINLVSAYHIEKLKDDNLRLLFDETGELKSAEVLK